MTVGGDVQTKSRRTRRRFHQRLADNLVDALDRAGVDADVDAEVRRGRMFVATDAPDVAADVASRIFGVQRVEIAARVPFGSYDELVDAVAARARARVVDRTFAVRVQRFGSHDWRSIDAERDIGSLLDPHAAAVDLDHPEVEVRLAVIEDEAWLVERELLGPGGMPYGVQGRVLTLLSGGFDSAVAAWMVSKRGCEVDYLHVRMDCSQTEQALSVARALWDRWGGGARPNVWIIDFAEGREALLEHVPPRVRQVVLKQLMFAVADAVADELGAEALVTGDAIGQVSSQTLRHLVEIDRHAHRPVLRPLAGLDKAEIVDRARSIGTFDLSVHAREVCDLSGANVAVGAQRDTIDRARAELPDGLVARLLVERSVVALEHWTPGMDAVPVLTDRPAEGDGQVVVTGRDAIVEASRLRAQGTDAAVLAPRRRLRAVG